MTRLDKILAELEYSSYEQTIGLEKAKSIIIHHLTINDEDIEKASNSFDSEMRCNRDAILELAMKAALKELDLLDK